MLLLHLADIHFQHPACATPNLDPDRPFRTRLIQDARERVRDLGNVDAILVGGDIAFKGAPEEYAAARTWLAELAAATNSPEERILVVPGNHDVDRRYIGRTPATRNAQAAIRNAGLRRERELRDQFSDPETGRALLAPLGAYNEFAARYSCQVFPPDQLYWTTELPFEGGLKFRVHGLTSTILSGFGGGDDTRESLYLSPLQTVFDPIDNTINAALCHHPPDWFSDHDDIEDAINGRAPVQFFGHKHRQRITRDPAYIRFNAGAVNPDRNEAGWQPGYNLVVFRISERADGVYLEIDAHLRMWQAPDTFRSMLTTTDQREVHQHSIKLRNVQLAPIDPPAVLLDAPASAAPASSQTAHPEATMPEELTRKLILRFWNLTSSQRRDIARSLDLISEAEVSLPEPERYALALRRARERNLLRKVLAEIERYEPR
jgi:predicted phosphodiesterase